MLQAIGLRRLFSSRSISLRSQLTILVLVTLTPLLIFSALLMHLIADRERDTFERGARDRTHAVLTAIDTELKSSITTLQALASLSHFDRDDLQSFREDALHVLRTQPHWLTIKLATPSGKLVMNLLHPSPTLSSMAYERTSFDQVLRTMKPTVGNIFRSPVTQHQEFSVRVPIIRNGVIKYVLSAVIGPQPIYDLLLAQRLPSDWIGVVLDANHRIVGRTVSPDQSLGQPASANLRAALERTPEGWFKGTTIDGTSVYTAFSHSNFSGWTVALGIPAKFVSGPFRGPVLYLVVCGIVLLVIGTLLASWLSSKTAASIESLVSMVRDLGFGKPIAGQPAKAVAGNVREVEHLKNTFLTARRLIQERSEERDRFEDALHHDITQRIDAERALAEAIRRKDALYEFLDRRQRAGSLSEMYDAAIDAIFYALRCARAAILLHDSSGVPRFVAWRGLSDHYRKSVEGHSPWNPEETDPQPIRVSAVAAADFDESLKAALVAENIEALAFVPILVKSRLAGKFMIYYDKPHDFNDIELQLSLTIARQLAYGIERKQAEDEISHLNEELEQRVAARTDELQQANAQLLRDIEQRKNLEQQLLQSQKMESIGTLAGGVAHDFNNILNIIQAYASLLAPHGARNDEIADSVMVIKQTVKRGSALVQQLLTLARKSRGPALEPLDLNALVDDMLPLIRETFPKTIEVSRTLEPELPPIRADKNQIEQALLNLAVNARDAMPNGGRLNFKTRSVDPSALQHMSNTASGAYACVEVSDSGVGIDETIRERIFEPFFTTKETAQGTGLGLSVVYGIVNNHDGFVDLESKPMKGTTFRLYFPFADVSVNEEQPVTNSGLEMTALSSSSETILIAEDEANMLHLLEKIFSRRGYKVLTATNGQTALDLYQRHKEEIAVVLLDMGLPKISGRDVLHQIKSANCDVKVIITSGYIEPSTKSEIDDARVKFLHKPYTPEDVFKTLGSLAATAS